MENNEHLSHIRHTLAHLLAQASIEHYPNALLTLGPSIDNGFYYDIDFGSDKINDENLVQIEKTMKKNLPSWKEFSHKEVSVDEAKEYFKGNIYKLELIDEIVSKGEKITLYTCGNFTDLCRGGHTKSPAKEISVDTFKLDRVAGAYWRGDEKNKMLTRIYGLAFETKEELGAYIIKREESEKRDHRKLGKDLGLFVFSDLIGKGLPTFGPKGATIKRELERFTIDEEIKRGYNHVVTPDLAKVDLYKKSGHYPYYKDTMYPIMKVDEEELILKPMTCPHHFMFYKSEQHSYKDLPYRIGEIAHQYRYEKSGELSGLTRVRMFCLADAHIISAKDQAKQVIKEVLELIDFINEKLGMIKGVDYRYRLSLGDRTDTEKYYKDDSSWNYAEDILRNVLTELKAPFYEATNEAAFYGPKIDIQVKKVSGKEETAFTVQYDFVMPDRFDLTFINKEGKEEKPVVIHRSSIGCLERTMAFLIEKFAGAFPLWLSPIQVTITPISEKQKEYAEEIYKKLKDSNIRVELDSSNESLGKKIRNAKMQKVPYIVIIGDKEKASNTVTVEGRIEKLENIQIEKFLEKLQKEISEKILK